MIDDAELRELELDLGRAPLRLPGNARKAMEKSAVLLEREMRKDARGHRYLPKLAASASHEVTGAFDAEVGLGPKRGTQGSLAHIIVHGSVNNAPVYDYTAAGRRSVRRIADVFADAAEDAVLGTGRRRV